MRYIDSLIKKMITSKSLGEKGIYVEHSDYYGVCYSGLKRAAELFDLTKNTSFLSYATFWMEKGLREALYKDYNLIYNKRARKPTTLVVGSVNYQKR